MGDEPNYKNYAIFTYGAHFVEVGVDIDTAEIRLRRMLGVFAAGRFLNTKTARSQLIGGMTWGVSAALMEESIDHRYGSFIKTLTSARWTLCFCTKTIRMAAPRHAAAVGPARRARA